MRVKLHNKSITVHYTKENDGVIIHTKSFDAINASMPACEHICQKGIVRVTTVKYSIEAMEIIIATYLEIKSKALETVKKSEK